MSFLVGKWTNSAGTCLVIAEEGITFKLPGEAPPLRMERYTLTNFALRIKVQGESNEFIVALQSEDSLIVFPKDRINRTSAMKLKKEPSELRA